MTTEPGLHSRPAAVHSTLRATSGFIQVDPLAANASPIMIHEYPIFSSRMVKGCACATLWVCLSLATGNATAMPGLELQLGRSYMDRAGATTVFGEGVFSERRIGSTGLSLAPDLSVGWIDGRSLQRYRGSRYTTDDSIWLISGGVRIRYGTEKDWYHRMFFSFQPSLHTGRTQALSSAYEFVSTLGWQGRRFSFQLRHISNASFHEPNRGETMALLGLRFAL